MRLNLPYYWTLRTAVGCYPGLFNRLYRCFDSDPDRLVGPQTELVIEGFPRSANSFSVNAFTWAQGRAVNIANHIHVPGQIFAGLALGKPVCLLIRPPEEAIPALLAKIAHFSPRDVAAAYARYYRALQPYRDAVVLATFAEATGNFGQVIDRLNEKFSMNYKTIDQETHDQFSRRFLALDKYQRATTTASYLSDQDRAQATGRQQSTLPELSACQAVYREFTAA